MKHFCIFFLLIVCAVEAFSQDSVLYIIPESTTLIKTGKPIKIIESKINKTNFLVTTSRPKGDSTSAKINFSNTRDSLFKQLPDSTITGIDSLKKGSITTPVTIVKTNFDTSSFASILPIDFLPFNKQPLFMYISLRDNDNKDELFYVLCGSFFFMGLVQLFFPKYFQNLFTIFFQTSFRQKQTREQLLQNNFASLLMNILFVVNAGMYVGLLLKHYPVMQAPFWWMIFYSIVIVGITYLFKFILLSFSGWLFNVKEIAAKYIFIVFLSNKILSILLLPILLMLAFSSEKIIQYAIFLSIVIFGFMLLYRYFVSMTTLRKELKVNAFHFLLYLCGFEILPLLIVYKLMVNYMGNNI